MLSTTVGQLLVNDALPEELRDYNRVLDGKSMRDLLQQVARQHPEKYREVSFRLSQIGRRAAQDQGGMSFGIRHLRRSKAANEVRQRIQGQLQTILADDSLTDQQRTEQIIRTVGRESEAQQKAVLEEAVREGNPLGMQVLSGSRGKPMNLASLLASDMLYSDHRDEVIPIPVLRSYSEGLSPEEYWAGTYGARRGILALKFATQDAGFLSKQLNQASHRLLVTDEHGEDEDLPEASLRGMVVDTGDMDNEGSLLARDAGPYKRNTPLTPKILKHLDRLGVKRLLVRSPLVGGSPEGGVYARDVGIRERGTLPGRGEQVGLQAAQALSEPISQAQMSAKHSGGVAGQEKAVGGFQYINQLIQVPKKMQGGAAHATMDGMVQRIEEAPAGGHYVTIGDKQHYVGEGFTLKVKKGDEVEAGDVLSDGIPNPAIITQYKGVGEGRRYFVNEMRKAILGSGMKAHRRNIELLARGLINHVRLTEETDEHVPDDVVPYSTLEHTYKPREGHQILAPRKSLGQYLERPVLHYTIGTKVRPSMLRDLEEFGVGQLTVHADPPPFESHMVRGMYQMQHDPDWRTQMYGSGLKKSLQHSTARGSTSDERGTSFVPSLAVGLDFGSVPDRAVVKPQAAYELPKVEMPPEPKLAAAGTTFFGGRFKLAAAPPKAKVQVQPSGNANAGVQTQPQTSAPVAPSATPSAGNAGLNPNIMPSTPLPAAVPSPAAASPATSQPPVTSPPPKTPAQQQTDMSQTMRNMQRLVQPGKATRMLVTSRDSEAGTNTDSEMSPQNLMSLMGLPALGSMFGAAGGNGAAVSGAGAANNGIEGGIGAAGALAGGLLGGGGGNSAPAAVSPEEAPAEEEAAEEEEVPAEEEAPVEEEAAAEGDIDPQLMAMPPQLTGGSEEDKVVTDTGNALYALFSAPTVARSALNGSEVAKFVPGVTPTAKATLKATDAVSKVVSAPFRWGKNLLFGASKATDAANAAKLTEAAGVTTGLGRFAAKAALPVSLGLDSALLLYDMRNKGWDQTTNETAQHWRDILKMHNWYDPARVVLQGMNLPANAQVIAGTASQAAGTTKDVVGMGLNNARTKFTGKDEYDRSAVTDATQLRQQLLSKVDALRKQRDQLQRRAYDPSVSVEQRMAFRQQAEWLQDRDIAGLEARVAALNDETANWPIGVQNPQDGTYPFRTAMAAAADAADKELSKLQTTVAQPTPAQKLRMAQLQQQQAEYAGLLSHYDREVNASGVGSFDKLLRNNVMGKRMRLAEISQLVQEASSPQERAELTQEYQNILAQLQIFRGWAAKARL